MRLHRLSVSAFGPFAGTQEVDFDELSGAGIFLLHGPTGAGKTSVLDAVCYALYGGVPGARQSAHTLRSDHAEPHTPTEVMLDLTVAGRRLELTRRPEQPRPKKRGSGLTTEKAQSRLREHGPDGAWKALSRSHQEIGEEVGQLLGMTREQFCQVVLLPQGDFARFLRAGAEDRAKLLGRLFDTRRFAAVEERLAELRREAGEEVRAGDERLLTLAHRMKQAAGSLAEPPAAAPGDVGLTDAVLDYAAQERTTARERRDVAESAALLAEAAHAGAVRALDEARERARLQQQHMDARRRHDALEEQRPERERARRRLERARSAESVAAALELRAGAGSEHEAAAVEERDARRRLPERIGTEPAERLAARERQVREDLGSLAAARRAESRAAAIGAELAGLEREAYADEEIASDADGWLAGWETTRAGLEQRIDAARDAATRAEHLAGRLAADRRRLDAARRRDRLTAEERDAEAALLDGRERAAAAQQHWLELKERRLRGIAAELAARLADGEPCPVCGSEDHPAPARAEEGHVDRATEERALAGFQELDQERERAAQRAHALGESAATAAGEADGADAAALARTVEELAGQEQAARREAAGALAAREALEQATAEYGRRLSRQREAERRTAARTSTREALLAERTGLEAEVAQARGPAAGVADRAAELERQAALLQRAADAARQVEVTALRLKETDARLADAAYRAGFATPQEAAEAVLGAEGQRELQHRLDAWQREQDAVAAVLADPQVRAAAGQPPADPDAARILLDAQTRRLRDASAAEAAAHTRCTELDWLSDEAAAEVRRLAPLRTRYDRVARLSGLASGTSAENRRKMRLESYVLAARLEQVALAASARLHTMSSGRYTLVHSAERGGRGRSGLGLHVIDGWTGRERDTATLSGGESFFASLALALGLADVVTEEAGGVRLDTLFIDEGFGSLDEQTLDEVLDVLDALRERDRTVGIVSHVPDLRQRIPVQLEVVKTRSGSRVRQLSGPRPHA